MPTYTFEDIKSEEEFEIEMSIAEWEVFLKDNPHLRQTFHKVNYVDASHIGRAKPPSDFSKYVLGKVKNYVGDRYISKHGNNIERRFTIPKEI